MKLNLGSGKKELEGFTNIDIDQCDLNKFPYPWADNSISDIIMDNVLEHLENPEKVMQELWRICKNHATLQIMVPWHKYNKWKPDSNPSHRHTFKPEWFKAFETQEPWQSHKETPKEKFKIISIKRSKMGIRVFSKIRYVRHMATYGMEVTITVIK